MEEAFFATQIMGWYLKHQRDLPWRTTKDPYLIWLSEIILQQTRVAQGMPYYHKFAAAFPTVQALAAAPEQEVMRLWQGLGYYSRARNLHACAQLIVERYGGVFPDHYDELLKLKGIGAYTAAAIASFAFNETVPVVDGNVYRVLSRVFGIKEDILSGRGQKVFRQLAGQLVPEGQAYLYNQAIMEFGALQCTPATPACLLCPLSTMCYAYQHGQQRSLPVKVKKVKIKQRYFNYFVIRSAEQLLMKRRTEKDIWAGLYDFYLIADEKAATWEMLAENPLVSQLLSQKNVSVEESVLYKHQLTHQQLWVRFYVLDVSPTALTDVMATVPDLKAFTPEEIQHLPKPILVDNFLRKEIF